jgi:hypothetical protein
MSNTVLSFMDFFWIWFVVAIASGGATYLSKPDPHANDLESLKQRLAALTEEVRRLNRGNSSTS